MEGIIPPPLNPHAADDALSSAVGFDRQASESIGQRKRSRQIIVIHKLDRQGLVYSRQAHLTDQFQCPIHRFKGTVAIFVHGGR